MAHIDTHSAAGSIAQVASGQESALDTVRHFFGNLLRYRKLARAERELAALDDRMLADIGVVRTEIHQRVWGGRPRG